MMRTPAAGWPCARRLPAPGGKIDCLDPGGFGAVTITKSLTIDCGAGQVGSILAAGTNGINVSAAGTDIVRIRNLSIQAVTTGSTGSIVDHNGISTTTGGGIVVVPARAQRTSRSRILSWWIIR